MITAFSFTHNSVVKGEPFVEAITQIKPFVDEVLIVDMESTDNTRDVLRSLGVRILISTNNINIAFDRHNEAISEQIIHFYPNEIYAKGLLKEIRELIEICHGRDISILRLVVEQNFQRVRWYPDYVHRIFRRGTASIKDHTTNKEHLKRMIKVNDTYGYLWAFQDCFLHNWQQLSEDKIRLVPCHFIRDNHFETRRACNFPQWKFANTPVDIPLIMRPHVGRVKYNPYLTLGGK